MSARVLRDSEVTPSLTAWTSSILHDPSKPLGYQEDRDFGGKTFRARVETHTFIGRTGQQVPGGLRGVTLYAVDGASIAAPHDADFSPTTELAKGLDVSAFQPGIGWSSVASAGYSFAGIKVSEGLTYTSKEAAAQHKGSGDAGLVRIAYHFFRSTSDPCAQVRRFLEIATAIGDWDGFALDAEWQSAALPLGGLSAAEFADHLADAIDELADQGGAKRPLLYIAPGFYSLLPTNGLPADRCDVWLAHYTTGAPSVPAAWPSWAFWQFTESGFVPGVNGKADIDRFCGTADQLRAWAKTGKLPVHHEAPLDLSTGLGLQKALNRLGASPKLAEDGVLGPASGRAVAAFQRSHGLRVDSLAGPATRAAIKLALAADSEPDTDPTPLAA